jgi:hypothetical protein
MSATCFHALDAVRSGWPLTHPTLAERIAPYVREIDDLAGSLPPGRDLVEQLKAHCTTIESNARLARVALDKAVGMENYPAAAADHLVRAIDGLESAIRATFPGGVDQIALRGQPLKAQWEARGGGLLTEVGRITDPALMVPQATVVLVDPLLGGDGVALLQVNSVWIEAVLTDALPELPEALRLGWLLAQLHCDIPVFGERVPGGRLPRVAALAMLPPILTAAQVVEWSRFDEASLTMAIEGWRLGDANAPAAALASTLFDWWSTYTHSRPHWSVALAALDHMLGGG